MLVALLVGLAEHRYQYLEHNHNVAIKRSELARPTPTQSCLVQHSFPQYQKTFRGQELPHLERQPKLMEWQPKPMEWRPKAHYDRDRLRVMGTRLWLRMSHALRQGYVAGTTSQHIVESLAPIFLMLDYAGVDEWRGCTEILRTVSTLPCVRVDVGSA